MMRLPALLFLALVCAVAQAQGARPGAGVGVVLQGVGQGLNQGLNGVGQGLGQGLNQGINGVGQDLGTLPQSVDDTLRGVEAGADTLLADVARTAQSQALLRRNGKLLEADPAGHPMVRGEVVAFAPTEADLAAVQGEGFSVVATHALEGLETRIVVLRAPQGMATATALTQLRALLPTVSFDFNHIYFRSGEPAVTAGASVAQGARAAAAVPAAGAVAQDPAAAPAAMAAADAVRVGLIDGGIDAAHPAFHSRSIQHHGCNGALIPDPHGTAVASLLVGQAGAFRGAAAGASLYAADVYCGRPDGGAVDAVADALSWLVRERVPVINVSLVGPPDATLEAVVRLVVARGFILVAAVGNDGPAAPPMYPASWPGVVGVTAVDAHRHALLEAARGPQVHFAAPGADMVAARSPHAFGRVRGTSFASPLVAGLLALQLHEPGVPAAVAAVAQLERQAQHPGNVDPDPVYGRGIVGMDLAPALRLASLQVQ